MQNTASKSLGAELILYFMALFLWAIDSWTYVYGLFQLFWKSGREKKASEDWGNEEASTCPIPLSFLYQLLVLLRPVPTCIYLIAQSYLLRSLDLYTHGFQ